MDDSEAQAVADTLARSDAASAFRTGLALLDAGYAEILLPAAKRLSDRNLSDARLAQLHGLAAREVGESGQAFTAFARAARLAPADALIAHSHARTAMEAGKPAADLFERASTLAPMDGSVLLGLAAALVAERRSTEAVERLQAIVTRNPLWTDGQRSLAHLRGQLGLEPLDEIDAAISAAPQRAELHRLRIATLLEARRHEDADRAIAAARASLGTTDWIDLLAGHIASELGDGARADALFASAPRPSTSTGIALIARHALRSNRPEVAAALLEPRIGVDPDPVIWPYLSLAWRLLDDPRWQWLEGDESLVGVYDLADRIGNLDELAAHLRSLHFATEEPLDQSVRGGTQTDGNLLLREEEPIRELRRILLDTVATHVSKLAEARENHPTLISRRSPRRISGSWSVRLRDAGFHSDHVHNQGWISSALYVVLPDTLASSDAVPLQSPDAGSHAGWLSLGECRDLVPNLAPVRLVEPRPGRLVLFPSTMWHGTRPFPSGERMTVAFDIGIPKQS